MFVGEAPGDLEDRAGHPFVGPAGKLLDVAMLEAGIDRTRIYLTNSVKHFRFVVIERGRRLHKKPNAAQMRACDSWVREEIRLREFVADLRRVAVYLRKSKAKVAGSR